MFLTNQQLNEELKTLTKLIFTISMISQSSGDFRFKNELDTIELVFIDERTAELVHSDVLTKIINSQVENRLLTELLLLKPTLDF